MPSAHTLNVLYHLPVGDRNRGRCHALNRRRQEHASKALAFGELTVMVQTSRLQLFFNLLEVAISSGSSGIEALSGSHNVYMHTGYGRTRNLLAVKTDVRLNDRCQGQEPKALREKLERNVWREYAAI